MKKLSEAELIEIENTLNALMNARTRMNLKVICKSLNSYFELQVKDLIEDYRKL